MTTEDLIEAMKAQNPGWATKWASQEDLREFARGYITMQALELRVARELFEVLRAAVHAGLLKEVE